MSNLTPKETFREDKLVREAADKAVESFKYLAGVCWAPVVVVMAFFRGGEADFGWFTLILLSTSILGLMIAGSLFFLAYQKQTMMIVHMLMGDEAIEKASSVNPRVKDQIETTKFVAWRLGHLADTFAFPIMAVSYVVISLVAVVAVWT